MTIGDVLAVVAGVFGFGVTMWALLIASATLFGKLAVKEQAFLEGSPFRTLMIGATLAGIGGLVAILLLNQANGLFKLVGWVMLVGLLALGAVGGGGVVSLVSYRLRKLEPSLTPFGSLLRGAGLTVVAGLAPILGWFFLIPLAILASLGMAVQALVLRSPETPLVPVASSDMETLA